jgi:hypothetical protein
MFPQTLLRKNASARGQTKRKSRSRHGAAAVEMAIVLPLFLTLIFGIIEFGRAMMVQQILVNTAREAARRAVIPGATDQQVHLIIKDYMTAAGISEYEAHFELDGSRHPFDADSTSGDQYAHLINYAPSRTKVGVDLSVLHSDVAWGPMYLLAGERRLSASVIMRKE